jgi:RNA polymerase sigma-70 factor (ECF subfamily)
MGGPAADVAREYDAHRAFLWGLCYRLTGSAADADDLVQETFVRALSHPPARAGDPWRPWLVRVALNLGRDLLRRRRRQRYDGPWLPSPVETEEAPPSFEPAAESSPAARYDLLESVSFAFLLALEALTPAQRAVLLLRDVFDYSVRETAEALGFTEANVKTIHLRARRGISAYDRIRQPSPARAGAEDVLARFLAHLQSGDVKALESLLAKDVRLLSDGGGEFVTALKPVEGRDKVTRLVLGLAAKRILPSGVSFPRLNGAPAVVLDFAGARPPLPPRVVWECRLDGDGRIAELYWISASRKLTALSSEVAAETGISKTTG